MRKEGIRAKEANEIIRKDKKQRNKNNRANE